MLALVNQNGYLKRDGRERTKKQSQNKKKVRPTTRLNTDDLSAYSSSVWNEAVC